MGDEEQKLEAAKAAEVAEAAKVADAKVEADKAAAEKAEGETPAVEKKAFDEIVESVKELKGALDINATEIEGLKKENKELKAVNDELKEVLEKPQFKSILATPEKKGVEPAKLVGPISLIK